MTFIALYSNLRVFVLYKQLLEYSYPSTLPFMEITLQITHLTLHISHHTLHITYHTSHISHCIHTSNIAYHTSHVSCYSSATLTNNSPLSLQLLEHMLRPLAKIYPMEWRSVLVDFGTPPTEHLFIRVSHLPNFPQLQYMY